MKIPRSASVRIALAASVLTLPFACVSCAGIERNVLVGMTGANGMGEPDSQPLPTRQKQWYEMDDSGKEPTGATGDPRDGLSATDAYSFAIKASSELAYERRVIELRAGAWRLGFRAFLPRLGIDAGQDERISAYSPDSFGKTVSVRLDQPIWDGGRAVSGRNLEAAELRLARSELDRNEAAVGDAAIISYREVLAARERLAIRRSLLAAAREERTIMDTEAGLGLRTADELLDADINLAGLELETEGSRLDLREVERALAFALGLDALPELTERLDATRPPLSIDEGSFTKLAVERSPQLEIARLSVERRRVEARVAARAWLPTIGIYASGSLNGAEFPLTRYQWNVGLSVSFESPFLRGTLGGTYGREGDSVTTARTDYRAEPVPDPAGAVTAASAALAYRFEQQRYRDAVVQIKRSAGAAIERYRLVATHWSLAGSTLALARRKRSLAVLNVELGKSLRSELAAADLEVTSKALDLIDAAAALIGMERDLERILDLEAGALARLFPLDPQVSSVQEVF